MYVGKWACGCYQRKAGQGSRVVVVVALGASVPSQVRESRDFNSNPCSVFSLGCVFDSNPCSVFSLGCVFDSNPGSVFSLGCVFNSHPCSLSNERQHCLLDALRGFSSLSAPPAGKWTNGALKDESINVALTDEWTNWSAKG